MDREFIFEDAIKGVKSKKIREYLKEVFTTYYNGEYRSCIVMLYATTFVDALEKIKILSEVYQSDKASLFLTEYEKGRKSNKSYSALERDVKEFIVKSGLINDVETKQWDHLKDYRDYCAHPVVENNYELISPNQEQVRMHIRNMFEALFLKDSILVEDQLFDEFIHRIESFYDRNGLDELEEYVQARYISKLDIKTKFIFIKNLWKIAFYINDEECNKYRRIAYRALIWIIQSDKTELIRLMNNNNAYFDGRIEFQEVALSKGEKKFIFYENKTLSLLYFLYRVPEVYPLLSGDNKTEIISAAKKNINLRLIAPYLFTTSKAHVEQIIREIKGMNFCLSHYFLCEIVEQANIKFDSAYNDLIIYYFFNCQNSPEGGLVYEYIDFTYEYIVSKIIKYFNQVQLECFLSKLSTEYTNASCFEGMAKNIFQIVKEKGFNIDYKKFKVDITPFVERKSERVTI